MPAKLRGRTSKKRQYVSFTNVNYDYDYPNDMNLKPGTKEHDTIRDMVIDRAYDSYSIMSQRHDSWKEIDRTLTAYIRPNDSDKIYDRNKTTPIIVPMSYATLETLLTYMVAAFFQSPMFPYEGMGPEDIPGAILLQEIIQKHVIKHRVGLAVHTALRDAFAYGFGAASPIWRSTYGQTIKMQEDSFFSSILRKMIGTGNFTRVIGDERELLFEGNDLMNINVYSYLPDPNASIIGIQEAEFTGWVERTNIKALLYDEKDAQSDSDDREIFNVRYLHHVSDGLSYVVPAEDTKGDRQRDVVSDALNSTTTPIDVIRMYMDIIPAEEGLGDSEYPERWMFAVAADNIVIEARPLGLAHGMTPIAVASPDFDGYSTTPIGKLEIVYPLQATTDWLFQSHIANTRKALNDMFVVDPSIININDFMSPRPGKTIRVRKPYWGRDLAKNAVHQLRVSDVTRGHVADTTYLNDLANRSMGTTDMVQGIMRTGGERRSATEARGTQQAAMSRLEKAAKLIGLQFMNPIADMFAQHTQQFMSEETFVKISGDIAKELEGTYSVNQSRVKVNPKDININYDIIVHDGSLPGGEPADLWIQLLNTFAGNPEMAAQLDIPRIFKHVARQLGAKNVDTFIRSNPVKVVPDEEALKAQDQGNLVPVGQGG